MPVELPDVGIALRTYLRESTVLADADHLGSADSIYVGWPFDRTKSTNIPPYRNIIVIQPGRGGEGDIGLAQQRERVDIFCYGANETRCARIWRAVDYFIMPWNARRKTSFTRNGCQVNTILKEGGPLRLTDPDAANWPYTLGTYIVTYSAETVS